MNATTTLASWTGLLARDKWHNPGITTALSTLRDTSLGMYLRGIALQSQTAAVPSHLRYGCRASEWRRWRPCCYCTTWDTAAVLQNRTELDAAPPRQPVGH